MGSSNSTNLSVDWGDALMHILIVTLAIVVLGVSLLAYERRKSRRYLLLSFGFFFLFLSQFATLLEVVFLSNALIIIPSIGLHLSHVFDFLTLIFFLLAISGYGQNEPRKKTMYVPFSGASKVSSPPGGIRDRISEKTREPDFRETRLTR
jgi:hypothetical protein